MFLVLAAVRLQLPYSRDGSDPAYRLDGICSSLSDLESPCLDQEECVM